MAITSPNRGASSRRLYHFKEMGLPILFGAAVLLGSATLLLFTNVSALQSALTGIDQTQKILVQLSVLDKAMLSQEMTVRGLALTGDGRFAGMEAEERARLNAASAELAALSSSDPSRHRAFSGVLKDVAANRDIFARLAAPGPEQAARVAKAILNPAVRESMRKARAGAARLRNLELDRLAQRQHQMTDDVSRAFRMAVVIIVTAFVLGGVGVWALRLQMPQNRPFLPQKGENS